MMIGQIVVQLPLSAEQQDLLPGPQFVLDVHAQWNIAGAGVDASAVLEVLNPRTAPPSATATIAATRRHL